MSATSNGNGIGARVSGTGVAIPEKVLTNQDLAQMVETSDDWIAQRTGIRQRRIVENGQTARHLGADAIRQALQRADLEPKELDFVINASLTPEMCCPSTGARIVSDIDAVPAGAVDISAACSGFVYGLNLASSLIQSGQYRHIAVIGAEVLSAITN